MNAVDVLPMMVQTFQDDMLQIAVDETTDEIINTVEHDHLQQKIGIAMSDKEETNRPFQTSFEFIGAQF